MFDRIANPEYTGENRCLPCMVVNLCIAVGLTGVAWWATTFVIASVVLLFALFTIAVRGYLIPGTPTLTARYLPNSLLSYFDGHETEENVDTDALSDEDVESILIDSEILEECPDGGGDLCLSQDVRDDWARGIEAVDPDADVPSLLDSLVDIDDQSVTVDTTDGEFVVSVDGDHVGRWLSWDAFVADVTAADVLAEALRDWDQFSRADQSALLAGLRLFLDVCPTCGESVGLERRSKESCCRTRIVTALECQGCGTKFLEVVGA